MTDAWGVVPVEGRGSLPFALVHGESLLATAAFALEAAGAELLDPHVPWIDVQASDRPLVLHDPLCPLVPIEVIREALHRAEERSVVVVGHRPVTDTVKEYDGVQVGATVDRSTLVEITSPIVLPAAVVDALEASPTGPFADIVERLRGRWPVDLLEVPPLGRRVHGEDDLAVLEALSLPR
ncbi:2-C-methyl-D-erythritol 4-phosphate cytidylyltransferase [Nocardioides terrisoli]|uniref:2-C-methyl-D-erythritol 4-phosphate cytidylyltransferase n=1 Tax=Nocardioides terrisoli TaxID=3388267 RepID=UPI00287BB3C1|nr:2-C-methyl-D-erythritol 4-phosphate cytidylyltransferase [Nocardioides marmorisolisilvae]